jgi:nucleoside-diphosphate-sugar epimerase
MILENYKVVITGHTGFLGKNLMERFSKENTEFLLIGRSYDKIDQIKDFNPDFIFHFGAEIYDDSVMIESNILLTYKILEAIKNIDFKAFIYCGSSSEYGAKKNPMKENDILEPRTMYEATKGSCTLLCQAYAKKYNKPIAIVRPFSVYGRYEKEHRFIPTLFRKFQNRESIRISPGNHDFIHVDDFTDGVLLVANSKFDKIKGQIINLGTGVQYTNLELFEAFTEIFGYEIEKEVTVDLMRPFDSDNWVANIDKAKQMYNFSPKYDLLKGLKKCYEERNIR